MLRIDTHHHIIPPDYRNALRKAGIDEAGAATLPTLLAFAKPGHITFGSDWPFAPVVALFPRLGKAPAGIQRSRVEQVRHAAIRAVMRRVSRLIS